MRRSKALGILFNRKAPRIAPTIPPGIYAMDWEKVSRPAERYKIALQMLKGRVMHKEVAWASFAETPIFFKKGTATIPPPDPNRPLRIPVLSPRAATCMRFFFMGIQSHFFYLRILNIGIVYP